MKNKHTEAVFYLIFDKYGKVSHLGIEGIRGWDLFNPDKVEFKMNNVRLQFEHIRYGRRVDAWRRKK